MHRARINRNIHTTKASSYIPRDGDTILCADPDCSAEMVFVPEYEEQGGIIVPTHFRSKKRNAHRENCSALKYDDNDHADSVPVETAISNHWPIILNLNDHDYNWGMPPLMVPRGISRKDMERQNTPLFAFQRANTNPATRQRYYAPYSVKSVQDMSALFRKMDAIGMSDTPQKIHATWQQSVSTFDRFYLDTKEQIENQFWQLQTRSMDKQHRFSSQWQGQDYACSAPRLFQFIPAKKTKDNPYTRSNSTSMAMQHPKTGDDMILINRLDFRRASTPIDREKILTKPGMVLAVPRVSATLLSGAAKSFHAGKTGVIWAFIDWMVVGSHQIMPSDDFASNIKPDRSPQLKLL